MEHKSCTLYFRKFPESFVLSQLEDLFSEYGNVIKVFVHHNGSYGMVEYVNASSCDIAIAKLHNTPPLFLHVSMAKVTEKSERIKKQKNNSDLDTSSTSSCSGKNNDSPLNRSSNQKNKSDPGFSKNMGAGSNDIIYIDRFNKPVEVFEDQNGVVYVPLHRVTGIRRCVRKRPEVENEFNENEFELIDDSKSNKRVYQSSGNRDESTPRRDRRMPVRPDFNERPEPLIPFSKFSYKTTNTQTETSSSPSNDTEKSQGGDGSNSKKTDSKVKSPSINKQSSDDGKQINGISPDLMIKSDNSPAQDIFIDKMQNKEPYKTLQLPENEWTEVSIQHIVNDCTLWVQIVDTLDLNTEMGIKVTEKAMIAPPVKPTKNLLCFAKFDSIWFRAVVLATEPKVRIRYIDYGNECEDPKDGLRAMCPELASLPAVAICITLLDGAPFMLEEQTILKVKPIRKENIVVFVHLYQSIYNDNKSAKKPAKRKEVEEKLAVDNNVKSVNSKPGTVKNNNLFMSRLHVGSMGFIEPSIFLSETSFVGGIMPAELGDELIKLQEMCENCRSDPNLKPQVGTRVAAQYKSEGWCRAILLEIIGNEFKVAFVDYGYIENVKELRPIPPELTALPDFSCVCTISKTSMEDIKNEVNGISFEVTAMSPGKICVKLSNDDKDICIGDISAWKPFNEEEAKPESPVEEDIDCVLSLLNGDKVQLQCENNGHIFVRTRKGHDLLKNIIQIISQYAPSAPHLTEKPKVAQIVAAHFDNEWYRAVVRSVTDDQANIFYVDYGNDEEQPWTELKVLSKELKQLPFTLFRVKLKNYGNKFFSQKALNYLAELAEKKTVMVVNFEGSVESGIELVLKNGSKVAAELNKLDSSTQSGNKNRSNLLKALKCPQRPAKKQYNIPGINDPKVWISEVPVENIEMGKANIHILHHINLPYGLFAFALDNVQKISKMHTDLLNDINNYVHSMAPKEGYEPEANEVVLAKYQNDWRRAFCMDVEDNEYNIFFLEYGIIDKLPKGHIKRIPSDFINFDALAYLGQFQDIPDEVTDTFLNRFKKLIEVNTSHHVNILDKTDADCYTINFPEISKKLKEESFI